MSEILAVRAIGGLYNDALYTVKTLRARINRQLYRYRQVGELGHGNRGHIFVGVPPAHVQSQEIRRAESTHAFDGVKSDSRQK